MADNFSPFVICGPITFLFHEVRYQLRELKLNQIFKSLLLFFSYIYIYIYIYEFCLSDC